MPNMANITVKKNDGTTDVVYTQQIPSAGDKSPAIWRNLTVGSAASHRPELKVHTQSNGNATARRVNFNFMYPTLVTGSDGRTSVSDRLLITISALVPLGMPDVDLNEGVAQGLNLAASSLIKDTLKSGFAPS